MTINKWGIYVIIAVAVLGALWFAYTKYQDANENAEDATARRAAGDVAESENPLQDYKTVRTELETYNPLLLQKPEHVLLSKSDAVDPEMIAKIKKEFGGMGKEMTEISIINPESMESVKKILNQLIKEKTAPELID